MTLREYIAAKLQDCDERSLSLLVTRDQAAELLVALDTLEAVNVIEAASRTIALNHDPSGSTSPGEEWQLVAFAGLGHRVDAYGGSVADVVKDARERGAFPPTVAA